MAKKKPYRYPLYLLARSAAGLLALLPRHALTALAAGLGRLGFRVITRQRNKTVENLTFAFGGRKTPAEIYALAEKVFENSAVNAAEILQFPKLNAEKIRTFVEAEDGLAVYRSLLEEGRGLISLTAHLGNWELLAGTAISLGIRGSVVARRIYYEPFNRWLVGLRSALNVETIYRDESPRKLLKILKSGGVVGILPDQDIDSLKGVFIDFMGRPAYTPVAPAKLAIASGAPILPNFLVRLGGGRYRLLTQRPLRPQDFQRAQDPVLAMTRAWMQACEKVILEYPDQWAWMHNRWKTRPDDLQLRKKGPEAHALS